MQKDDRRNEDIDGKGLSPNPANLMPLTPISFIERAADVFPTRIAWIYGSKHANYATFRDRARRLASSLIGLGVRPGDTVAVMLPNTPPMLESHFGVPMAGAVLNCLNTRLEASTISHILAHGRAKVLIVDSAFSVLISEALRGLDRPPCIIDAVDAAAAGERLGSSSYEDLLRLGDPDMEPLFPDDEWQAIGLNYTSGTTGEPKGVVIHHRGAHLNAVGQTLANDIGLHPVYLWTLPMFHCNGWTFTWSITLQAGIHVCLRKVEAGPIYEAIGDHGVTHMGGAPVVMNMIANAPDTARRSFPQRVVAMTGGAAPPAMVLQRMAELGIDMVHLYGLTESYGPATVCAWQQGWSGLAIEEIAAMKARQGVAYPTLDRIDVLDRETGVPVPADGETIGEIVLRGNTLMKGYLNDPQATQAAFSKGWYHTGDLAVRHRDGYVDIKDRAKDIIISGGENVSSIEVENVLYRHPAVLEAAVVARPDDVWGERPCAFVALKQDTTVDADGLIEHCRHSLAGFKIPRLIVFGPLPKTSTGKVQQQLLRIRAKNLA